MLWESFWILLPCHQPQHQHWRCSLPFTFIELGKLLFYHPHSSTTQFLAHSGNKNIHMAIYYCPVWCISYYPSFHSFNNHDLPWYSITNYHWNFVSKVHNTIPRGKKSNGRLFGIVQKQTPPVDTLTLLYQISMFQCQHWMANMKVCVLQMTDRLLIIVWQLL